MRRTRLAYLVLDSTMEWLSHIYTNLHSHIRRKKKLLKEKNYLLPHNATDISAESHRYSSHLRKMGYMGSFQEYRILLGVTRHYVRLRPRTMRA